MRKIRLHTVLIAWLILSLCGFSAAAQLVETKSANPDEQRLIEKIKDAVMKELREGRFFQEQVEIGIQNFVRKQDEAQVAARAERERAANEQVRNVRRVSLGRDHIFGDPRAPVSLIEYSDFECPFCKRFHATAQQIVEAYPGKVNWVYRHFPLAMHNPGAQKQAEASECAAQLGGNEAFWKFTNAIYDRTSSGGSGFPLVQLAPLGREIGVNDKQLLDCIDSGKNAARVQEDLNEGAAIAVTGTPASILIHNTSGEVILKVGAQPFEAFKPDIDKLLNPPAAQAPGKGNP